MRIIFLLIFLTSCMSEKKLAKVCAEKFPIKDSIVVIETTDTTYEYIKGDSIRIYTKINEKIYVTDTICPEKKVPTIIKFRDKIVYQENTARIRVCQEVSDSLAKVLDEVKGKNKNLQEKISNRTKQRNWLILILALIIAWKIVKIKIKQWI